jgi:hypothetical protein
MLLSKITVDPARFQFRDHPYSEKTVNAIVSEGINLAKFDPIPVLPLAGGKACVAGDGHSRYEAIRRLIAARKMPAAWKAGKDWNIPTRAVDLDEAQRLGWTANLSRDNFTPCEEAKVFKSMLDAGISLKDVAAAAHKGEVYVTKMLLLNTLCHDIRVMVGAAPEVGGIDKLTAQVLASGFERYGVNHSTQQQLWHCFLKCATLNFQSAKKLIDRIGGRLAEKSADGMLFAMPANVATVLQEARERGSACRSAKMGLSLLAKAMEAGGLEDYPDLAAWMTQHGQAAIDALSERVTEDAEVLAGIIAPPKMFKPIPADATDAKIARQYDPKATPSFC